MNPECFGLEIPHTHTHNLNAPRNNCEYIIYPFVFPEVNQQLSEIDTLVFFVLNSDIEFPPKNMNRFFPRRC